MRLLSLWRTLDPTKQPEKRALGERYYPTAVATFKKQHGGAEVAIFPPVGEIYLLDDGEFRMALDSVRIKFDWSDALRMVFKIDALASEAKEWWQGTGRAAAERKPHSMRAYGLATCVAGAIHLEDTKHPSPPAELLPEPSEVFKSSLASFETELADAQRRFREAAQRTAQSRYWRGTLVGAGILALLSLVVGAIFWQLGVDAAYGVALPAGGLGAMISVLQRMSSGKLVLDYEAGRDLLEVFGAVRPFIGAVFGLAVMALLLGGLVPAIEIPTDQMLAFFAGVGFLAGFNERWAQDMLKGSTTQLGGNGAEGEGSPAAAAG